MEKFLSFLQQGVSPFHTVEQSARRMEQAGFTPLALAEAWDLMPGGRYVVRCFDSSLVAFAVGRKVGPGSRFRVAAAHTDWPCLRVKPSPEDISGGCCRLQIEPYGGAIYSTWLDRPLTMAGKVCLRGKDAMAPESRLVSFDRPVLTIPNVAIHLNREVNRGVALKGNTDMLPLCRTVEKEWEKDGYLLGMLAREVKCQAEEILSYDLCVASAEEPCLVGLEGDMLSSPRLDNLTSVYACVEGIRESVPEQDICVIALYDNEEVGSGSKQGAASAMLPSVLEKAGLCLGLDRQAYLNALMGGILLSCDVAHAVHPNHPELYDAACRSYLNGGVTLKMNFSQGYPTDAEALAVVEELCRRENIPLQRYMNRADLRGGSTIGAVASPLLSMPAADVGVPILAMHSCRELMGSRDEEALCRLARAFLR